MQISLPAIGETVRTRALRWRVVDRHRYDDCALVALTGTGEVNSGRALRVLTPFDRLERSGAQAVRRYARGRSWGAALRSIVADARPADALWAARTARLDVMGHQLAPVLAITRGRGSRLLIADEVGLGKTIEAGLVIAELVARQAAERVLVLTPAGLREQWLHELGDRFGLDFVLLDMAELHRRRARLPAGVNPWSSESLVVTSIDYAKRAEVLPAISACRWDVVVIDEAHGVTAGERQQAAARLCGAAAYVVLLTATPHNGDAPAYASLCTLGAHADALVSFRRTRADIGLPSDRRVHQLDVGATTAERRMMRALEAFARAVRAERKGGDVDLPLTILRKRACSSAFAFEQTVRRRLDALAATPAEGSQQLGLQFDDPSGEYDADEEPAWTCPPLSDATRERALLTRLAEDARAAAARETKLAALVRLLRRLREPAIVFTEYRDTLAHVARSIGGATAVVHGGLSREERQRALAAFHDGHARILVATDAAGEGLNLHRASRVVINFELPWNPVRLEQRIGRVDRIGQRRRVHAFHLVSRALGEQVVADRIDVKRARATRDMAGLPHLETPPSSPPALEVGEFGERRERERVDEEQRRLEALRRSGPTLAAAAECSGTLLHLARRRRLRLAYGRGVIALLRWTLVDTWGRAVASHITALRVPRYQSSSAAESFDAAPSFDAAMQLSESITVDVDPSAGAWLRESRQTHGRFWRVRSTRERAIRDAIAQRADARSPRVQQGLFDRREARREDQRRDSDREALERAAARIDAADAGRDLTLTAATALLLLV